MANEVKTQTPSINGSILKSEGLLAFLIDRLGPQATSGLSNAAGNILGMLGSLALGSVFGNLAGGNQDVANASNMVFGNLASNFMSGLGLKGFTSMSNLGNLGAGVGSMLFDSHTAHQRNSGKYGSLATGVDLASSVFGANPYGALGMGAVNYFTGGTDGMTVPDALLGSSGMAAALTAVNPFLGAGYITASAVNNITGKTTTKNANNDVFSLLDLNSMWGSYGKSSRDHTNALKFGNKKYGGISRLTGEFGRADREVLEDNYRTTKLLNIFDRRELGNIRGAQMGDINNLDYRLETYGGYNPYGTRIGRKGMKLEQIRILLNSRELPEVSIEKPSEVETFKDGGQIQEFKEGGQMNVIPEGALHARKNNMEGAGEDFTHKGIPVMDKHGEQLAEIERNEIIFNKEVTTKLEKLMEDGSEQAAIDAGKLLVKEIFENTDDRTGLISEIIGEVDFEELEELAKKFKDGGTIND